jgi:uncharacterized protein YjbI with pentapeptide repeats
MADLTNPKDLPDQPEQFLEAATAFSNAAPGASTAELLNLVRLNAGDAFVGENVDGESFEEDDLSFVSFAECGLQRIDAKRAKFVGSILDDADLTDADLRWAFFKNSSFVRSRLNHSDFREATLLEVTFGGAQLDEANFQGSKLVKCNLTDVGAERATFVGIEMTMCRLQSVGWLHVGLMPVK